MAPAATLPAPAVQADPPATRLEPMEQMAGAVPVVQNAAVVGDYPQRAGRVFQHGGRLVEVGSVLRETFLRIDDELSLLSIPAVEPLPHAQPQGPVRADEHRFDDGRLAPHLMSRSIVAV